MVHGKQPPDIPAFLRRTTEVNIKYGKPWRQGKERAPVGQEAGSPAVADVTEATKAAAVAAKKAKKRRAKK